MTAPPPRYLASGAAALLSGTALRALAAHAPRRLARAMSRTNHAGREVSLFEGPVLAASAVVGVAAGGRGEPAAWGAALGTSLAAAFGALDDHAGSTTVKGLRGHLGALARGQVTTGAVKILGIGATGVGAMWLSDLRAGRSRDLVDIAVGGAAVAACGNVANLFDLRPGRALKVSSAVALPVLLARRSPLAAAALGAAAAAAPDDLVGRSMLGDTGANALGTLVGLSLIEGRGRAGRTVVLSVASALILASEKVSFTRVIEAQPLLRRLDEWGRPRA